MRITSTGMASLHALPISAGHSLEGSALRDKYVALLGETYLTTDVSLSGPVLDSFFRPRSCLAQAQRLAAAAFGSDTTLFVTCGTTLANEMALDALVSTVAGAQDRPTRVLADRTCHQSIHFGLDRLGADITYCERQRCCEQHDRTWPDLVNLVSRYQEAAESGRPFDMVVLSAASYDGCLIDVHSVLTELLQHTDDLTILVDEAWSAINAFHPRLSQYTALAAARRIRAERPDKRLRMMVTHSAHKSMSALRQGSYLHVSGDQALSHAAVNALYRHHTTSPSLPILASLDLARAQAEAEGAALVERSLSQAEQLRRRVAEDPQLAMFSVGPPLGADAPWIIPDPTKVLVDITTPLLSATELRIRLARDHGIYVARTAGTGILASVHIGVTPDVLNRLLMALQDIGMSYAAPSGPASSDDSGFLIAYPPGIPLMVPGESADDAHADRVDSLRRAGVELFTV